jgi:RimJ/RimL family protein N-acetyltransferase
MLKNHASAMQRHDYVVRRKESSEVIAWGTLIFERTSPGSGPALSRISVMPEYRLQGIATALLAQILEVAHQTHITTLMTMTRDRVPSGAAFAKKLGACEREKHQENRLTIADLNHTAIHDWLEYSQKLGGAFEMGFWNRTVPEDDLEAFAQICNDMDNAALRNNPQAERLTVTPESIRRYENIWLKSNQELWTIYVRDLATGLVVGFTEVVWNPAKPEELMQAGTGVGDQYQNRGLEQWLKAAMLDKVLRERPQVKHVLATNPKAIDLMLTINKELGLQPYNVQTYWEVTPEGIEAYLASRIAVLRLS